MSRDDARRHQRILEETRATRVAVESLRHTKESKFRFLVTTVIALAAVLIYLYVYGPDVEAIDINVECPLCDRNGPFQAPATAEEANAGSAFNIKLRNSGHMGTTILGHNITFQSTLPGKRPDFVEEHHSADEITTYLGAQSEMVLSLARGAEPAYFLGDPNEDNYLYGHVKYRSGFWVPTTKYFCFRYQRGTKGLRSHWAVCSQ